MITYEKICQDVLLGMSKGIKEFNYEATREEIIVICKKCIDHERTMELKDNKARLKFKVFGTTINVKTNDNS
jgi:hypothetical protein